MKRGQTKLGAQTKATRRKTPKKSLERTQKTQIKSGTLDYERWHELYRGPRANASSD